MASKDISAADTLMQERTFFFWLSAAISLNALAGFTVAQLIGISSYSAPWWVHVHAVAMMAWLGLYMVQNWLVWRGKVASHRLLGTWAGFWGLALIPLGFATTAMNVHLHRSPPMLSASHFLLSDFINISVFGGFFIAALSLRDRTDLHRRLMIAAMVVLIGPGIARLLPVPMLGQSTAWVTLLVQVAYLGVGAWFDWRIKGQVHPAWASCAAIWIAMVLLSYPVSETSAFLALTSAIAG